MAKQVEPQPSDVAAVMPMLVCRDVAAVLDFCKATFGAEEKLRLPGPNETVAHAALTIGEAFILFDGESPEVASRSPTPDGSSPVVVHVICPPKTRPSPVLESGRGQDTKGEGTMAAPKRLSPAQIINRLRKAEVALANGNTTKEVCRELGSSEQTYYRWRREYGGMKLSQAKRLKELEKENQQLKRAVAELTLDKLILKEASEGNF